MRAAVLGLCAAVIATPANARDVKACIEQLREVITSTTDEHVAVHLGGIAVFVNRAIEAANKNPKLSRAMGRGDYIGVTPIQLPELAQRPHTWNVAEQTRLCREHVPKCECRD
jgi:hypothetical protein